MFHKNSPGQMAAPTKPVAVKPASASARKFPPTVIAADVNLLGNMISEGALDIDGRIEGNLRARQIVVRKSGAVIGDIVADTVQIYGHVKGLIKAGDVELFATARVEGVIMHESLSIEDGAFVDGQFKRTEKSSASSVIEATEIDILSNLKLIG